MHIDAQHLRAVLKNKNEKGKTHSHQSFKQSHNKSQKSESDSCVANKIGERKGDNAVY